MKLLQELLESADDVIQVSGLDAIQACLTEMRALAQTSLYEGFTDNHRGDLEKKFDQIESKLITVRRALGTVNAAKDLPPEQVKAHKSKLMGYINVFRKQLYDVMIELGMSDREMTYHLDRLKLDREYGKPSEVFKKTPGDKDRQFSSVMNQKRNLDTPDAVSGYVKPQTKAGNLKWYQKLFK